MQIKHTVGFIIATALALGGCLGGPSAAPGTSLPGDTGVAQRLAPAITGTVQFPDLGVQALPADIVSAATVTLINPATNQAVSTAMTNPAGGFVLEFSGGFSPAVGSTFIVEAFKGLANNSPGYFAPRFRTIIQLTGAGWTSITGTQIYINSLTTAVAIQSALDSVNIPAANTIGKITPPATLVANAFAPSHPDSEVYQLSGDISNYLTYNLDPLSSVSGVLPAIGSFNPTSGGAGTVVTVYGTGFNPVPGSTTVYFNGVQANVIYVAPRTDVPGQSRLAAIAPAAFTTGTIRVSTPLGSANSAANFTTDLPTISALSVATGSVGQTVTITGTNFDLNPSNDIVRFNGVLAPVSAASATSLTCAVPVGASSGNLIVTTNAGQSNARTFTVHPGIASLSRPSGPIGGTVVITGHNFDPTAGNNIVRFNGVLATVTSASATSLTCTVPAGAATGPLTVTVGGNTSSGVTFYVVPNLPGTGTL